jgi:flagellar biogenesis protein FliO
MRRQPSRSNALGKVFGALLVILLLICIGRLALGRVGKLK